MMRLVPYAGDEQSNVSPTAALLDLTPGAFFDTYLIKRKA